MIIKNYRVVLTFALLLQGVLAQANSTLETSGRVGIEARYFSESRLHSEQLSGVQASAFIEPELYWEWNDGKDSLTFEPYYRIDGRDNERSHGDIRELSWLHVSDNWELHLGLRRVFWGVAEGNHLVDIINQTDAVEDIDGEDKLGQPMANLSLIYDWGVVDLFILPGFRERTFAGEKGRLREPFVVDVDNALYESDRENKHIDYALRWSHSLSIFDIGVSGFSGTNREPQFVLDPGFPGDSPIVPYYEQIDQLGIDVQATQGDWLWKLEAIYRDSEADSFAAAVGGFEYTLVGVARTSADLGLLLEYSYDERGEETFSLLQNDLLLAGRLALNDVQSSELLVGISLDVDYDSTNVFLEASRRLGESWKVNFETRLFISDEPRDPFYLLSKDDFWTLSLEYYY